MKTSKAKLNSKGFSHVELILVLGVMIFVGAVAIYVFRQNQKTNTAMNEMGITTSNSVIGSAVKGSSVLVDGKSLGSIVPKASAVNLSHVMAGPSGWNIYACRTYVAAYAGIYAIQGYFWKPSNVAGSAELAESKPGGGVGSSVFGIINNQVVQRQQTSTYSYGLVSELTMNVSALNTNHTIWFDEQANNGSVQLINTFTIPNLGKYIVNC